MSSLMRSFAVILLLINFVISPGRSDAPSSKIVPVAGITAFNELISAPTLTFVKFFHPRCPHCQAMAPHFITLSELIATHNALSNTSSSHVVTLAEVDASNQKNERLINTHAYAFPTLKLYASGRLISEFNGPRNPQSMLQYIQDALFFRSSQIVEYIHTRQDLDTFLNQSANRPVVLSIFHPEYDPALIYPPHIRPCPESWHATGRRMRNFSAPSVSFAAVTQHALLLPPDEQNMRRFRRIAKVPFAPAIAAASNGGQFWQTADWWFPGVREADSMETFMHVATVEHGAYIVLDRVLAPVLLSTTRPLALVFTNSEGPSWEDREFMIAAASQKVEPRFLSFFMTVSKHAEFSQHVGIIREDEENRTMSENRYVVYRGAVLEPMVEIFVKGDKQDVSQWLNKQAKQVNKSNFAISPGAVLDLDGDSWDHIFKYDGRGVLLELYRSDCGACRQFASVYQKVAKLLLPHTGAMVVASLDLSIHSIPTNPRLPPFKFLPTVVYVPPGGEGIPYEGIKAARALSQFARLQSETENIPFGRLSWAEMAAEYLLYTGVVMIIIGIVCRRSIRNKSEHVT